MNPRIIRSVYVLNIPKVFICFIFIIYFTQLCFSQNIVELETLVTSDAESGDESGIAVAMSGNYAVIGAWKEDHNVLGNDSLDNAGAVYIFERDATGDWLEVEKIIASDRAENDQFGKSVAIDGNIIIVGANLENIDSNLEDAGAAYVFEKNSLGSWIETQKLISSDRAEDDQFGNNVSVSGDYIIVGAPFEDQDTMNINTEFDAGSAYVFKKDEMGVWNEQVKLVAQDRDGADLFGIDVSIFDTTIIVGAYKEDINNSSLDAGAAYIFNRDINENWTEKQKLVSSDRGAADFFGFSVSISQDKAVVGAYFEDEDLSNNNTLAESGSAYVFEKGMDGMWSEVKKITATDRDAGDFFGYDVSISGNTILVGAPLEDNDTEGQAFKNSAGSGYIFERDSAGNWRELEKVVASNRGFFHFFGTSVSNSSDHILVGSPFADIDPNVDDNVGMSYVFQGRCFDNLIIYYDSVPARIFTADTSLITFGEVNVLDDVPIIFQAGEFIILTEGFFAKTGTNFTAKIDNCIFLPFQSEGVNLVSNEVLINPIPDESISSKLNLEVKPNPNAGEMKLNFVIPADEKFDLFLLHSSGQLLQAIFSGNQKGKYSIDFLKKNLSPGIYFLVIKTESEKMVQKLVVTNFE